MRLRLPFYRKVKVSIYLAVKKGIEIFIRNIHTIVSLFSSTNDFVYPSLVIVSGCVASASVSGESDLVRCVVVGLFLGTRNGAP